MPFSREEKQKAKAAMYNGLNGDEQTREARVPVENGDHDCNHISEDEPSGQCCFPKGCLSHTTLTSCDSVRFICNSETCEKSGLMHTQCAEAFEDDILAFLRSVGRARSWSDKQRRQNIWTKKGYDLIYKCCACSCGKGHLRKDLDYKAPADEESFQQVKSKRKKKKPSLVSPNSPSGGGGGNAIMNNTKMAQRKSSSSASCQSPCSDRSPGIKSPNRRNAAKPKDVFTFTSVAEDELGYSSSFPWRTDFAKMVTILPRQKINPCHIKMDDDVQNDDPRSLILKTLFSNSQTSMSCVMCQRNLPVFANYPLLDGTFFLSPREIAISGGALELELQSRTLFLTAVCMHCLQGKPHAVKCKFCNKAWDGSSHQIGTLYWFDIFAAAPCCERRIECRKCGKPVANGEDAKQYFSDYSRDFECPHCSFVDCHYVKPLTLYELAV